MLTVRDVSERLGLSADHVRALIHAGRLRALNVSRNTKVPRYRIDEQEIQRFREQAEADAMGLSRPRRTLRRARGRELSEEAMAVADQVLSRRKRAG